MAFKTTVTWGVPVPGHEAVKAKIAELIASGVADGLGTNDNGTFVRLWTTEQAATEWIDFVNSITPPPVSATVEEV